MKQYFEPEAEPKSINIVVFMYIRTMQNKSALQEILFSFS